MAAPSHWLVAAAARFGGGPCDLPVSPEPKESGLTRN